MTEKGFETNSVCAQQTINTNPFRVLLILLLFLRERKNTHWIEYNFIYSKMQKNYFGKIY